MSAALATTMTPVFSICVGDQLAEIAVHRGPDLIVVREREADIGDAGDRRDRRQDGAGDVQELDAAAAHLGEQIGVGAELAGREEPDLQPAAARLLDAVAGLLEAGVDRLRQRLSGGELVVELGGLRGRVRIANSGTAAAATMKVRREILWPLPDIVGPPLMISAAPCRRTWSLPRAGLAAPVVKIAGAGERLKPCVPSSGRTGCLRRPVSSLAPVCRGLP